jgi:hypothetical protein
MEYNEIEEAGKLKVFYEGPTLDLLTIGRLQINLHRIIEHVAIVTLGENESVLDFLKFDHISITRKQFSTMWRRYPDFRRRGYPIFYPELYLNEDNFADAPIVRTTCHRAEVGSWEQELGFAIISTLSHPDIRAALQGLGGNILYAIMNSGLRGISAIKGCEPRSNDPSSNFDPFDVGPNVADIAKHLIAHGGSKAKKLTITHTRKDQESDEIEIKLS